jgi:aerobic C4-dicarboxylate transport protein
MKKLFTNLNFQVIAGILLGVIVGYYFPSFGPTANVISKTFIKLITMLIAPIIFFTIVLGISGMSDLKKVGRVGGKALLYFEIVSTLALIIGVIVANVLKPGEGFVSKVAADTSKLAVYQKAAAEMHWGDFIANIVPGNIFEAFARGDIFTDPVFCDIIRLRLKPYGGEWTACDWLIR